MQSVWGRSDVILSRAQQRDWFRRVRLAVTGRSVRPQIAVLYSRRTCQAAAARDAVYTNDGAGVLYIHRQRSTYSFPSNRGERRNICISVRHHQHTTPVLLSLRMFFFLLFRSRHSSRSTAREMLCSLDSTATTVGGLKIETSMGISLTYPSFLMLAIHPRRGNYTRDIPDGK